MKSGTSLYLDLVRFCAALTVFIGHSSGRLFTGGFLWQAGSYMQTAVIMFFVLSGFVIAHVLQTREQTGLSFTATRFGRLYSVVLAALILTAVCDHFGLMKNPSFYYDGPWGYSSKHMAAHYLTSLLFINQWWAFGALAGEPGINAPFWSLSFEVAYYLAIGIIVFVRGKWQISLLLVLAALAGPDVVILAPLWLGGFWLYHIAERTPLRPSVGIALFVLGLAIVLASPYLRQPQFSFTLPGIARDQLFADYMDAIGFSTNLLGLISIADYAERILRPIAKPIVWLGSLTFALYLFHRPLIQLFAVYPIGDPSSWSQRLWLLGGTFAIVATLGSVCERQKGAYRRAFLGAVSSLTSLRVRTPAPPPDAPTV